MNIRKTFWAAAVLFLMSCGKPTTVGVNLNGRGFGGEDSLASALLANRTRAANVITYYLNNGDPGHHLCDASLVPNEPFLQTALSAITSDPTGATMQSLQQTLFTRPELIKWHDALIGATMRVSSNPADVSFQGQVQDAYTEGLVITYYRPTVTDMSDLRRVALELHEASHAETSGWLDTTMIGTLMGRQAIDARAACFATLLKYLDSQQAASVNSLFIDEFSQANGSTFSSSWHNRNISSAAAYIGNGFVYPTNTADIWADVPSVSRADVRVRATIDFNCVYQAGDCWIHLYARESASGAYLVGVGRHLNQIGLSLFYYDGTQYTSLASAPLMTAVANASNTYELDFKVVGNTLTASMGGSSATATDTRITTSGFTGMRFDNLAIDRYEIDSP